MNCRNWLITNDITNVLFVIADKNRILAFLLDGDISEAIQNLQRTKKIPVF